jgi:hypothetical protein
MNQGQSKLDMAVLSATLAAAAMIAFQVGSKATRDALFLSNFAVSDLPVMVMVAAAVSMAMVIPSTVAMARLGPARLMPAAFLLSGALNLVEWGLVTPAPRVTAVLFYLHLAAFGAILISGFWSLVNESLDPRTAKKSIGRIGAGATLGGLLGGILAERVGQYFSVSTMLPLLAGLHLLCAWGVATLARHHDRHAAKVESKSSRREAALAPLTGLQTVKQTPYLRNLAALVLMGAVGAGLLDFVLKAQASAVLSDGEALLRFFGIFYTTISLLTLLVQSLLSRRILESAGLARAVASLPATVFVGSVGSLFAPGLASASLARGGESVVHNSVFRSGYELLFNPVSPDRKRSTKMIIDVGFDRLGDAAGGGFVKGVLTLAPQLTQNILLAAAAGISLLSLFVASRLHRGYIKTLAKSLESRVVDTGDLAISDRTTRDTIMQTMGSLGLAALRREAEVSSTPGESSGIRKQKRVYADTDRAVGRQKPESPEAAPVGMPASPQLDDVMQKIAELRSGDARRIVPVLSSGQPLPVATVPHLISLLAWDEVSQRVIYALRKLAPRVTGQLGDALVDPDTDFAIRRRIPRVLAASPSEPTVRALMAGLADRRFEVRYQCGRALAHLITQMDELPVEEGLVFAAVEREATVDRRVWESQKLLESTGDTNATPFEDEYLRKRATKSLEHVFTLLSLVLPTETLMIAYRGLHTDDRHLRGTALEYLENVLPNSVREKLWPFLEEEPSRKSDSTRTREQVLEALMKSNQSIELNLRELRRQGAAGEEESS